MPKLVYLDSSDFSDLSAPIDQLSAKDHKIVDNLYRYRDAGTVTFFLSAVHLSEAVHAAPAYKAAAIQRAQLMERLCGSNILRFPNDIFARELKKAFAGARNARLSVDELLSPESEWFGLKLENDDREWRNNANAEFDKRIAHLPRAQRRRLKSELSLTKTSGRARWKELYRSSPPTVILEFPFNLLNRDFFFEWFIGERSHQDLVTHMVRLLSQPRALVEHILDATNERETIYSILRKEGEDLNSRLKDILERVSVAVSHYMQYDYTLPFARMLKTHIPKFEIYRALISVYADNFPSNLTDKDTARIIRACPALSVFASAYVTYACSLFEANVERIKRGHFTISAGKASDFGDLMHSAYAPYMDIFRCDAHFGAILRQNAEIRPRIVNRRDDLLSAIENETTRAA